MRTGIRIEREERYIQITTTLFVRCTNNCFGCEIGSQKWFFFFFIRWREQYLCHVTSTLQSLSFMLSINLWTWLNPYEAYEILSCNLSEIMYAGIDSSEKWKLKGWKNLTLFWLNGINNFISFDLWRCQIRKQSVLGFQVAESKCI